MTNDTKAPERIWAGENFWPNVFVGEPESCWEWNATLMGNGYGSVRIKKGGSPIGAHRVSWALYHGRWPSSGLVIMHSCDNPKCVNPLHLSEGTQSENIQDCVIKGRHKPFRPSSKRKTHCKHGHEYTRENTEFVKDRGYKIRRCKTCKRQPMNQLQAKK